MPEPNYQAVRDVRSSLEYTGQIPINNLSGNYQLRDQASTEGAAKYFIHGTGVEEALSILTERRISPSPNGPAGRGLYALSIGSLTFEAIKTAWGNVAGSGYCRGAALILCGPRVGRASRTRAQPFWVSASAARIDDD